MPTSPRLALCALVALSALGCGVTVHHAGGAAAFDPHPAREVTEDDIRTAFAARPQLGERSRVAYFTHDGARAEAVGDALAALPHVESAYRIPALLVTGRGRYDEARWGEAPRAVDVHQLRLLAARARCDVLVVFDYGYRVEREANGYAALNALLVPVFFAPFLDARVESYLDAFVIDVRNGYLYRHLTASQRGEAPRLTMWSDAELRLVERQWGDLLAETRGALAAAFAEGAAGAAGERVAQRVRTAPALPALPAPARTPERITSERTF